MRKLAGSSEEAGEKAWRSPRGRGEVHAPRRTADRVREGRGNVAGKPIQRKGDSFLSILGQFHLDT